tara:strand:- start:646 stop:1440 length:795 start_codon:yes stop_codon:yes gene_type:complete
MAIGLLFQAGAGIVRAATPAIARYLTRQGFKKATGQAAKKPVTSTVTSVKQAAKLKPPTVPIKTTPKVVKPNAANKPASINTTATSSSKPTTTSGLRADASKRLTPVKPKPKPENTSLGTKTQRRILTGGATIASLAPLLSTGKADKKTNKSKRRDVTPRPTSKKAMDAAAAKRKITKAEGREKRLQADSNRANAAEKRLQEGVASQKGNSWKDFKSVSSAQKAGQDYFMGRDGKKKLAVTAEQLKKTDMSLTAYANKLKKKGK